LRLQELASDASRIAHIGAPEKCIRRFRRHQKGVRIAQKIFFFDAELELVVRREGAFAFPLGNESANQKSPR
jgi:hypothetical protein